MFRYLSQEMLHIIIDFSSICFCGFRDAVDYGAGFCPADGVDQPPVVLADAKAAQCGFCGVVVQGDFTVFQKHTQILFLVQGVSKGFPCLGFWQDFILMLFYPCKISINQRFGLQLPPMLPFSGFQPRKLIINFINCPDLL